MVAYSFQKRFAEALEQRRKTQTIRKEGKRRHAMPGDAVQIYVGMRTVYCRKVLPDQVCASSEPIIIDVPTDWGAPCFYRMPERPEQPTLMIDDAFAKRDGFRNAREFVSFFIDTHGPGEFRGRLIQWREK